MASAKMASAIDVRIDDVGSILKFRIGFPFGDEICLFLPVRVAPGVDSEFPQKECDHFFSFSGRFWSLFGHFFLMLLSLFFVTFLPDSFCRTPFAASGIDTEFPCRVRIVDRGVDCRDPVCRHRLRFLDTLIHDFPATGPPDPRTDFKAPGSLAYHRFRDLLEELSKGS